MVSIDLYEQIPANSINCSASVFNLFLLCFNSISPEFCSFHYILGDFNPLNVLHPQCSTTFLKALAMPHIFVSSDQIISGQLSVCDKDWILLSSLRCPFVFQVSRNFPARPMESSLVLALLSLVICLARG